MSNNNYEFCHVFPRPGIFAYLNYLTPKTRREIIETLIKGLQRLEYRGYDSAGKRETTSCALLSSLNFKPFSPQYHT